MKYYYSIEMFIEKTQRWQTEIRIYQGEKNLNDSDLCDIFGKRKNARLIKVTF